MSKFIVNGMHLFWAYKVVVGIFLFFCNSILVNAILVDNCIISGFWFSCSHRFQRYIWSNTFVWLQWWYKCVVDQSHRKQCMRGRHSSSRESSRKQKTNSNDENLMIFAWISANYLVNDNFDKCNDGTDTDGWIVQWCFYVLSSWRLTVMAVGPKETITLIRIEINWFNYSFSGMRISPKNVFTYLWHGHQTYM